MVASNCIVQTFLTHRRVHSSDRFCFDWFQTSSPYSQVICGWSLILQLIPVRRQITVILTLISTHSELFGMYVIVFTYPILSYPSKLLLSLLNYLGEDNSLLNAFNNIKIQRVCPWQNQLIVLSLFKINKSHNFTMPCTQKWVSSQNKWHCNKLCSCVWTKGT